MNRMDGMQGMKKRKFRIRVKPFDDLPGFRIRPADIQIYETGRVGKFG